MAAGERTIISRRFCVVRTQPTEEVIASARVIFHALGPCPMWHEPDDRPGIAYDLDRDALLFSKWHVELSKKRVFITRKMMGL